jgi:hypothetical protein
VCRAQETGVNGVPPAQCGADSGGYQALFKRLSPIRIFLVLGTYIRARAEVASARFAAISSGEQGADTLNPCLIPSMLQGDWTDRVIAEVDQYGFVFAADARDAAFFGANQSMTPKRYNRIQIVLRGRRIYLRKSFIWGSRPNNKMAALLPNALRWGFYVEAAALLRLRGFNGVPRIRRIDARKGVIEMDYIWGRDLHQILSAGRKINEEEIYRSFEALLASDKEISRQNSTTLSGMVERGVVYRDLKPANMIIAECSQRLYVIDFQDALLRARKT